MTITEIRRRQRLRQRWLERRYGPDELAEMDLDERSADQVYGDMGDSEFHQRREN